MLKGAVFAVMMVLLAGAALAADQTLVTPYTLPESSGTPWTDGGVTALRKDIDAMLLRPVLRGAHAGLVIVDTQTGRHLYDRNGSDDFMPASNFKLLVGSAAIARLGPQFTLKTTIATDGSNLFLRGGGEVILRAKDLDDAALAIAARGTTHIIGNIITDAAYFDDQRYGYGWSWDDFPYYYAPVISALGLEDNVIHIYMRPGAAAGDPVTLRIEPQTSAVTINNQAITGPKGSKDTTDIVRNLDDYKTITLTGSYPLNSKESDDLTAAVPDPAAYAGDVFLRALAAHGVTVEGAVKRGVTPVGATTVWTHASEPLGELLEDFWWPSDNLIGEILLKTLGVAQRGVPGTDDHGIAVENDFLKSVGVNPATVSIVDGSGLSHYNHITPDDLVAILQADWHSPNRSIFVNALPLAGVRGTLKSAYLNTPAEKNTFAKTGSISHVRTISGYLHTRRHGIVTFSFLLDDFMDDDPKAAGLLATLRGEVLSRVIVSL